MRGRLVAAASARSTTCRIADICRWHCPRNGPTTSRINSSSPSNPERTEFLSRPSSFGGEAGEATTGYCRTLDRPLKVVTNWIPKTLSWFT
jgi:hypothetical protein